MDIKEVNVSLSSGITGNHPWEYARAKVVMDILKKYSPQLNRKKYVLDIGCGDLFFLNQYCKKNPSTLPVAVDTAFTGEMLQSLSKQYQSINVSLYDQIDKVNLSGNQADIIFLMDVIEHINDDIDFLKELSKKSFVNDDTVFLITVPSFNNLYCSHDKWLGHYRRYNQKMLRDHSQKAGLKMLSSGYFFTTLILPRLIQKWLESARKKEKEVTGIGGWNGGKVISKAYEIFLLCDYYFFKVFKLLGINFPGLSTYAICKRQS
ncbi:MAG: class I SAM-dependent methyltransferase [Bacteroidales bacterium]|nr:class I SAM-dependent methyltransferase [Bacteroidales bacterium]